VVFLLKEFILKQRKDIPHIKYYELSKSDEINFIMSEIEEDYALKCLVALSKPVSTMGNHKILTLKYFHHDSVLIRIAGPAFIIEDIYTIWFSPNLKRNHK